MAIRCLSYLGRECLGGGGSGADASYFKLVKALSWDSITRNHDVIRAKPTPPTSFGFARDSGLFLRFEHTNTTGKIK
jgi:hypothetical protein